MFGGGGFLSGLGDTFGRAKAGLGGLLNGTTADLVATERPDVAPMGERDHALKQMPQIQATGKTSGGLLDKMREPDARGLTFGDKLFASGSVLRGDSGGAASYLHNQRQMADVMGERKRARDIADRGRESFAKNYGPDGLDFQNYLKDSGGDPMQAIEMAKALAPTVSTHTPGAGGLVETTRGPFGGPATTRTLMDRAPPKAGPQNPDGSINWDYIKAERQKALAVSSGHREGAPLAPRAPARPRAPAAAQPRATGRKF